MKYLLGLLSYGTLKMNKPQLSLKMMQRGLAKKIGGRREPVVGIFLRRARHSYLLETIESMKLDKDYKSYLKALVLKHEKRYQEAWTEVEGIENEAIVPFKVKLLYDMKSISKLAGYTSDGIRVLDYLDEDQQRNLIGYLAARKRYGEAERMIALAEGDKKELQQYFKDRTEEAYSTFDWPGFSMHILGRTGEVDVENIDQWKMLIDHQEGRMRSLGYVLFINHFYMEESFKSRLNRDFVPYLKKNRHLHQYIELGALHNLDFEIDPFYRKGIELQKVLEDMILEGQSCRDMRLAVQLVPQVNLTRQHIISLRRLILENKLDLNDPDFIKLVGRDRRLRSLFIQPALFITRPVNEKVDAFLYRHVTLKDRRRIYQQVLKQLLHTKGRMHLPRHFVDYLEKSHARRLMNCHILVRHYHQSGEVEKADSAIRSRSMDSQLKIRLYIAKHLYYEKKYDKALEETKKMALLKPRHPGVLRNFIRNHHGMGDITQRYHYIEEMKEHHPDKLYEKEFEMARDEYILSKEEWSLPADLRMEIKHSDHRSVDLKGVYVLNKAMPAVNGYTVRSQEMIKRVKEAGGDPLIVTRLGWSPAHEGFKKSEASYEGVKTHHIDRANEFLPSMTPLGLYFDVYAKEIAALIESEKPAYLHAASNFQNAFPALKVGRAYGISTIYEVRGLWHYTQSAKNPLFYRSERFEMQEKYEIACCLVADEVICISESLKRYLMEKGVAQEKITVIPNGVDTKLLKPESPDQQIIKTYGLKNKYILGFIGSLTSYEGIDLIFEALKRVNESKLLDKELSVIIVGDGEYREALVRKAKEMEIESNVIFTGKVGREDVHRFYSVMDIAPFPRKDEPVCQLVTPLKPYEAMAMGKKVIVSDVDALKEMIEDGINGKVFEAENAESLSEAIIDILDNVTIGKQAREWVVDNRDWDRLVGDLMNLYNKENKSGKE